MYPLHLLSGVLPLFFGNVGIYKDNDKFYVAVLIIFGYFGKRFRMRFVKAV